MFHSIRSIHNVAPKFFLLLLFHSNAVSMVNLNFKYGISIIKNGRKGITSLNYLIRLWIDFYCRNVYIVFFVWCQVVAAYHFLGKRAIIVHKHIFSIYGSCVKYLRSNDEHSALYNRQSDSIWSFFRKSSQSKYNCRRLNSVPTKSGPHFNICLHVCRSASNSHYLFLYWQTIRGILNADVTKMQNDSYSDFLIIRKRDTDSLVFAGIEQDKQTI